MLRYMNSIPDLTDLFIKCDTGEAALHESCSYFNTSQFQSQRAEFQEFVRTKIIERYDVLYADITDLQVKLTVNCGGFFCIVPGNQCYHSQSRENRVLGLRILNVYHADKCLLRKIVWIIRFLNIVWQVMMFYCWNMFIATSNCKKM